MPVLHFLFLPHSECSLCALPHFSSSCTPLFPLQFSDIDHLRALPWRPGSHQQGPIESAASLCPVTLGWERTFLLCGTLEECFPLSCHLRGSGGWKLELWSQKVWVEILDLLLTSVTLGKVIKSWWPGFLLYVMEIIIACTSYGYRVNAMSCIRRMKWNIVSTE